MTLWDQVDQPPPRPAPRARALRHRRNAERALADSMAAKYDRITRQMLERYSVRVRKWRTSMSGLAWQVTYADGTVSRLIEAPRPKGPMSAAVFLHEIGHHAIGFNVYRPRCLEEYHAWAFAMNQMTALELNITDGVRRRVAESLWYAVSKARRRGLRSLPPELEPYTMRPAPRRQGQST